jgi:hypothetical protein
MPAAAPVRRASRGPCKTSSSASRGKAGSPRVWGLRVCRLRLSVAWAFRPLCGGRIVCSCRLRVLPCGLSADPFCVFCLARRFSAERSCAAARRTAGSEEACVWRERVGSGGRGVAACVELRA